MKEKKGKIVVKDKKPAAKVSQKSPAKKAAVAKKSEASLSEEDIRLSAYFLWLERGGGHGAHDDDWLVAERKLKKKK